MDAGETGLAIRAPVRHQPPGHQRHPSLPLAVGGDDRLPLRRCRVVRGRDVGFADGSVEPAHGFGWRQIGVSAAHGGIAELSHVVSRQQEEGQRSGRSP